MAVLDTTHSVFLSLYTELTTVPPIGDDQHITHDNAHPFSVSVDQGRQGDDIAKRTTGRGNIRGGKKSFIFTLLGAHLAIQNGIIDINYIILY